MNQNQLAFFIGLFGSIHCIGMCGPLAFAIPVNHSGFLLLLWDKLIYNCGRIISYSILGLITGLIGKQLWLSGLQQGVSILSGVLIILAAFSRLLKIRLSSGSIGKKALSPINYMLSWALKRHAGHLVIGILNGFLPCGFVYLALVGAVNVNSVQESVQYMAWFGLGTLPLMLAATVTIGLIDKGVRRKINYVIPYLMIFLGFWFVLRGLALDIPYLSPPPNTGKIICK